MTPSARFSDSILIKVRFPDVTPRLMYVVAFETQHA